VPTMPRRFVGAFGAWALASALKQTKATMTARKWLQRWGENSDAAFIGDWGRAGYLNRDALVNPSL